MLEFSLGSDEVIRSGIVDPFTGERLSRLHLSSAAARFRKFVLGRSIHPATANVEGRSFSLVGSVNHRLAARKAPLGRNLDGFRKDVMTRGSCVPTAERATQEIQPGRREDGEAEARGRAGAQPRASWRDSY